jgi:hypothetical protein
VVRLPRGEAGWLRVGLAGAVATYVGLAALWALAVPLFVPADESPHVDYAFQVAHGHLPSAGTHFEAEFPTLHQHTGGQYVAYHPPLYYVLVGPLVRAAGASSQPRLWLLAVRGVGILLTVLTLVLIAKLATRVYHNWEPARRYQFAIIAAGLAGAVPSLTVASASIQNDALELLFVALALLLLAVIVREGHTPRRVTNLGLVCGLGMLTRVTFVQVLLVAVLTVTLVTHPRISARARDAVSAGRSRLAALRQQGSYVAPVVLGPVLLAGWFYLLNHSRYGSFTGSSVAYENVTSRSLTPRLSSPIQFATDPLSWWVQLLQVAGAPSWLIDDPRPATEVIATVLAVGIVLGAGALLLRRRAFGPDRDGWILLLGLALILVISFAEIASHVSHKGSENSRYLLDALPFWGIAVGAALMALCPKRYPLIPVGIVGAEVIATVTLTATFVHRQQSVLSKRGMVDILLTGMRHARVPMPSATLVAIVVLLGAGLLFQLVAVVALGRPREPVAASAGIVEDRPMSVLTP